MARIESQAVAGYYPTPQSVLEIVRSWLQAAPSPPYPYSYSHISLMDPCAGEGEALSYLSGAVPHGRARLLLCEMERNRFLQAPNTIYYNNIHGDFFKARFSGEGVGFLWLNPSYDTDPDHKRLEEKFLVRATQYLKPGGYLAFVVPFYALSASARTLAENYEDLECYRFPDDTWDEYKQVVLIAKRRDNFGFEGGYDDVEALVMSWSKAGKDLPVMVKSEEPHITLPESSGVSWSMGTVDVEGAVGRFRLWDGVPGIQPPEDIYKHFNRTFPVASQPRASHLASAMAAGIFNGMRITPNEGEKGLPPLLVKGVFDKEFRRLEDKVNKEGEKIGEIQVQRPKLAVCVLDLETGQYHNVSPSPDSSEEGSVGVEGLTMRDLFEKYGHSMMRGMMKACPVLREDDRYPDVPLPPMARTPYPAQADAIQTLVKLRKDKPQHGAVVLGEIGVGKSITALATAKTMGEDRVLIMCPPHLLTSWKNEIRDTLPEAQAVVLDSVTKAQHFVNMDPSKGMVIGILSRETAKLGHSWESAKGQCPKCGTPLKRYHDYSKKRELCSGVIWKATNDVAKWAKRHAGILTKFARKHPLTVPVRTRILEKDSRRKWDPQDPDLLRVFRELADKIPPTTDNMRQIAWAFPSLVPYLYTLAEGRYGAEEILLASPNPEVVPPELTRAAKIQRWLHDPATTSPPHGSYGYYCYTLKEGKPYYANKEWASAEAFKDVLNLAASYAVFDKQECGEPLFNPDCKGPRRFPLATWISRYAPKSYGMLIVDESHEFSSKDSAQTQAAQRLMQNGAYTLQLTGSFMNGYAESVFMNMWALSPDFRDVFQRGSTSAFIDRYGYWKRYVQEKDIDGKVLTFGSQSDRVQRSVRKAGVAPGILPLFTLEHLLPIAVTLQKDDLDLDIPPRSDEVVEVAPNQEQANNFDYLMRTLMAEIKRYRFTEGLAGKLWGAMARLPHYYDLACLGNSEEGGVFEIRWPENVPELGGSLVASVPVLDPSTVLPKEQEMLAMIEREVSEGRNVMVMTYHKRLMPRIRDMIKKEGYKVECLHAERVPTAKRQDWITSKVVKKGVQVLITNPVAIQTGLNNLVHFATEIWMENPMCNPNVFRQACGRIDRIGQTKPSTILFPVYDGAQVKTHGLLMHKVGVATAVDGLDPEEALRAAGILDDSYQAFTLGKQIYNLLLGR